MGGVAWRHATSPNPSLARRGINPMENQRGKFIVLYGINNLGKTTQAKMLVHKLITRGIRAEYLKYPIYDLVPSGVVLNNYLRGGNYFNLSPREAQIFYAKNRTQYEKKLIKKLEEGINIIAEDYTGTGLAWGIGAGTDELFLKYINSHLLKEDLAFLFDGRRFKEATEHGHKHENDEELINKVRQTHLKLGGELGWIKINANLTVEEIHKQLWQEIKKIITPQMFLSFRSEARNPLEARNDANSGNTIFKGSLAPGACLPAGRARDDKKHFFPTLKLVIERLAPFAKLPTRAHSGDAGLDLYSAENATLFPGDITGIKTGIKMQIPDGYAGLIWDKSGLARAGLHTLGGVIDSGYRGEIVVLIKNLSEDIFNISAGQKIAQILIQKIETLEVAEGEISDETERDANGFGSSGMF
jgi:deoxyuridine 5'-triphosphate nucleotidohydrolase